MFPQRLDAPQAYGIAQAMKEGVNRHYQRFQTASRAAQLRFEQRDWVGQQQAQSERIAFYDQRVQECVEHLTQAFAADALPMAVW